MIPSSYIAKLTTLGLVFKTKQIDNNRVTEYFDHKHSDVNFLLFGQMLDS